MDINLYIYTHTPETRFSDPRFSEILDLVNKTEPSSLHISYNTMTPFSE